jgi:hypothetical protein
MIGNQMSQKNQANSETLEWLFLNKYYDGNGPTAQWPDNKGTCKAVFRFMTLMALRQYHSDP